MTFSGPRAFAAFIPIALLLLGIAPAGADPGFELLPEVPGAPGEMHAEGVSADGCAVVGWGGGTSPVAFRWKYGETQELPHDPNPPDPPPSGTGTAYGVADDGDTVVMVFDEDGWPLAQAFRWTAPVWDPVELRYTAWESFDSLDFGNKSTAQAISGDGQVIVGSTDPSYHGRYIALRWESGSVEALPHLYPEASTQDSEALDVSADGSIIVGSSDGIGEGVYETAVRWQDRAVTPLGTLSGATTSRAEAISPDGSVIVGSSGSQAFRYAGGSMQPLDGDAEVARGVSNYGGRIVGRGASGAFLWDPSNGTRDLAGVLTDIHGFDLGDWILEDATDISRDGNVIVGRATSSLGDVRAFRAALGEHGCPPDPFTMPTSEFTLPASTMGPGDLEFASNGDIFVGSTGHPMVDAWVVRVLAGDFPHDNGWEPVLDATGDGTGNLLAGAVSIAVALDDTLYAIGTDSQNGFRVDPGTGAIEELFDLAGDVVDLMDARPVRVAIAPDGAVLVAAATRVLRIAPDGSITSLLDALTAKELIYPDLVLLPGMSQTPLYHVASHPSGDVIAAGTVGIFRITPTAEVTLVANFSDVVFDFDGIFDLVIDEAGDIWFVDMNSLWVLTDAGPEEIMATIPNGEGGFLTNVRRIGFDADGNFYLVNHTPAAVVRVTPDGAATLIADEDSLPSGTLSEASDALVQRNSTWGLDFVYVSDWYGDHLIRVTAPPVPVACADGLDNDDDTVIDHPDDPGCVSPYDETEELVAVPEPNQFALLAAGCVTLFALSHARLRRWSGIRRLVRQTRPRQRGGKHQHRRRAPRR